MAISMSEAGLDKKPRVYVMMATYNGGKYLAEQVQSILNQRNVDVVLRICDDGSSDDTEAIVDGFLATNSNIIVTRNKENLGVGLNFMQMIFEVDVDCYDYFAFSDQDDVWLPDKLDIAITEIDKKRKSNEIREVPGYGVPILYCSDITNVDTDLSNPRRELQSICPSLRERGNPLVRNWYPGCTMVLNSEMACLAGLYRPKQLARIHDAWLFLIAFYCANVVVDLDHALILRRITGENQVGENFTDSDVHHASVVHLKNKSVCSSSKSARQLIEGYRPFLNKEDSKIIESVATYASSPIKRLQMAVSQDFKQPNWKSDLLMRIKFLLGRI